MILLLVAIFSNAIVFTAHHSFHNYSLQAPTETLLCKLAATDRLKHLAKAHWAHNFSPVAIATPIRQQPRHTVPLRSAPPGTTHMTAFGPGLSSLLQAANRNDCTPIKSGRSSLPIMITPKRPVAVMATTPMTSAEKENQNLPISEVGC